MRLIVNGVEIQRSLKTDEIVTITHVDNKIILNSDLYASDNASSKSIDTTLDTHFARLGEYYNNLAIKN